MKRDRTNVTAVLEAATIARDYALRRGCPIELPLPRELLEDPQLAKRIEGEMLLLLSTLPWDARAVWATRQYLALFRKNSSLPGVGPEERAASAIKGFAHVQTRNRISEKRLNFYRRHPSRMPPLVANVIGEALLDVQRLLGLSPTNTDYNAFINAKVFGPGTVQGLKATPSDKQGEKPFRDVDPYAKLHPRNLITTTRECFKRFGTLLLTGVWRKHLLSGEISGKIVQTTKQTTVPKDRVIDRVIGIEPLLNLMAQFGIAAMLEPYLRRWGINLQWQGWNQWLAKAAASGDAPVQGGLCTIDLSSASDTLITALVQWLLPPLWYELFDNARTKMVTGVEGYASFSTMGNAFTFPLQCLVYMSLARACCKVSNVPESEMFYLAVYGDDIVMPSSASLLMLEVLRFVGFLPNVRKSHVFGPFRESCGVSYYHNDEVTPYTLEDSLLLRSTRHLLFNQIQRRCPEHPLLPYLLGFDEKPLVGPAVVSWAPSLGYFEAPYFVLHQRVAWWYDSDYQAFVYEIPELTPVPKRRRRKNKWLRYLACLTGAYGRSHDVRNTVKYRVRTKRYSASLRLPSYAPIWYN